MTETEELELRRAAKAGYLAQAEACQQRIDELTGEDPRKRGRPPGSKNKPAGEGGSNVNAQ